VNAAAAVPSIVSLSSRQLLNHWRCPRGGILRGALGNVVVARIAAGQS
jgi:hypothetical protein